MKSKKVLAGILSASILSFGSITAFAANVDDFKIINAVEEIREIIPVSSEFYTEPAAYFNSFTGVVKEITDFSGVEGSKFVSLENEEGMPANIIVSEDTYIVGDAEIMVGSVITGYYDAHAPMIMIYPPQYKVDVVVIDKKDKNIKVDIFDEDLVSADNLLKLDISDDTKIITQDGKVFKGDLTNRKLVIIYEISTRSIPAQTTPTKIVVLFEEETVPPINDVSIMDIIVNHEKIEAPVAYTNEEGTVMLPLRAIAEALGLNVKWNQELQSITLAEDISFRIGEDNYIYMGTTPIQLGTAPELVEGRTFLPLSFFKELIGMNNVYVFESQIVIDNEENIA